MFAAQNINQPLLTDTQILRLIHAAPLNVQPNARHLSQRGRSGEQSSSLTGSGSDFAEVRGYQAGDELRHIDWRATARSQKTLIRTYYSEFSQPLCLVIDRRSAMRFATRARLKVTQALRMALWLGGREARRGREISIAILDSPCHWLPVQQGMLSLKLMARLANLPCPPIDPDEQHETHWIKILSGLKQRITPDSDIYLFSDFSGLRDKDNHLLRHLGQDYHIRAVHIMDSTEDYKNPASFPPTAMQLQWGKLCQYFAINQSSSAFDLKQQLQSYQTTMSERFCKANIELFHLGVEQDDLSAFSLKKGL